VEPLPPIPVISPPLPPPTPLPSPPSTPHPHVVTQYHPPSSLEYPTYDCLPPIPFPTLPAPLARPFYDVFGPIERQDTSIGTFYWPANSSEELTTLCLTTFGAAKSPLDADVWQSYLTDFPDPLVVDNVVRGLREGFMVGYGAERYDVYVKARSRKPEEIKLIATEFCAEREEGRMVGPFTRLPAIGPCEFLHLSPTFAISKPDGSSRRIDNLSWPPGDSVNDFVNKDEFPVDFATVDSVARTIARLPAGTLASVRDIQSAYRNVLINPVDWALLATEFGGIWLQTRMNFGGTAHCGLFERLSKLTVWITMNEFSFADIRNILDDFLFLHSGSVDTEELAGEEMNLVEELFARLGWPIKVSKSQTGTTTFTYLGVAWDTIERTMTLTEEKRLKYLRLLQDLWSQVAGFKRPFCTLKLLRSVVGKLVYAAQILPVGRTRLFWLFRSLKSAERRLRLATHNSPSRIRAYFGREQLHDLQWWMQLLSEVPVRRCFALSEHETPLIVTTDACNEYGIGGFFGTLYFSIECSEVGKQRHSTFLELLALVVAVHLWGPLWRDRVVLWRSDCKCHTTGLFKIRTAAPALTPLHDYLDFAQAKGGFLFDAEHLPGDDNGIADALSRGIIFETVLTSWTQCHPDMTLMPSYLFSMELAMS